MKCRGVLLVYYLLIGWTWLITSTISLKLQENHQRHRKILLRNNQKTRRNIFSNELGSWKNHCLILSGGENGTIQRLSAKEYLSLKQFLPSLLKFSRLHTLFGTTLSVCSLYFYALPREAWTSKLFYISLVQTLMVSWATNIYITGLNQIIDVDIDKINKNYLPLPANELSITTAKWIVLLAFLTAILYVNHFGSIYLQTMIICSLFLGTLYSLPPFQFKKNSPFLAAVSIAAVRGPLINFGLFFHARKDLYENLFLFDYDINPVPKDIIVIVSYFTILSLLIAGMKDIPDVTGDRYHHILTYSTIYGPNTIFRVSLKILHIFLFITVGLLQYWSQYFDPDPKNWHIGRIATGLLLSVFHWLLYHRSQLVLAQVKEVGNQDSSSSLSSSSSAAASMIYYSFYMLIWKLFYFSYFLLPFLK